MGLEEWSSDLSPANSANTTTAALQAPIIPFEISLKTRIVIYGMQLPLHLRGIWPQSC